MKKPKPIAAQINAGTKQLRKLSKRMTRAITDNAAETNPGVKPIIKPLIGWAPLYGDTPCCQIFGSEAAAMRHSLSNEVVHVAIVPFEAAKKAGIVK